MNHIRKIEITLDRTFIHQDGKLFIMLVNLPDEPIKNVLERMRRYWICPIGRTEITYGGRIVFEATEFGLDPGGSSIQDERV